MDPRPLGPWEIDGLLVPPGKAYKLLTSYLISGKTETLSLPRESDSSRVVIFQSTFWVP